MIVNADKFQAIIVKQNLDVCNQYTSILMVIKLLQKNPKLSLDEHFFHYLKKQVINLTQ